MREEAWPEHSMHAFGGLKACRAARRRARLFRPPFRWIGCLCAATLVGCVSVPTQLLRSKDEIDGSATQLVGSGAFSFLSTASFVSGPKAMRAQQKAILRCGSGDLTASVVWIDDRIPNDGARQACDWVLQAVAYADRWAQARALPIRLYRLYLAFDDGHGEMRRASSSPLFGGLKPTYLKRWYADKSRTKALVVDTFAHETMHLTTRWLGIESNEEENVAYLMGACAQLDITGDLSAENLSWATFTEKSAASEELRKSMIAGVQIAMSLKKRFTDGHIRRDSLAGIEFDEFCEKNLTRYFKTANSKHASISKNESISQ